MKALAMKHEVSPSEEIFAALQSTLDQIDVLGAHVLVAIYQRPTVTKGGVHLPDKFKDEDIYQGKVGLVLKLGPLAFQEDEAHRWSAPATGSGSAGTGERVPTVGDWVAFRTSDGWPMILNEKHCRMVEDINFRLILQQPDVVY